MQYTLPTSTPGLPSAFTYVEASATGAAATVTATMPAVANKTNYIEGFDVTGTGATAASAVNVTVTGLANTLNFTIGVPAGVAVDLGANRLSIRFPTPIPASAVNTAINVVVPSFGAGNTNASATIYGFVG